VVQPAPRSVAGQWHMLDNGGGIKMAFQDSENKIHGFVLTGTKTGERQAMIKLLAG
jgi:hypothetical protein